MNTLTKSPITNFSEPLYAGTSPSVSYVARPQENKKVLLNLGEITSLVSDIPTGTYKLVELASSQELINLISTWSHHDHREPEAILVQDTFLAKLNAEKFVEIYSKSPLVKVPFIVLSSDGNELNRKAAFSIGADGYFDSKTTMDDLLFKINFSKKVDGTNSSSTASIKYKIENERISLKRIFDIVCSGTALLILSPLMVLIAILVKLESRGPVFYISKRAGKKYKIFDFYKFRTMEVNADQKLRDLSSLNQYGNDEDQKVFFKIKNDPRITRFGKFLRNTSLDELPQLLNILKGDMSIVGNRPLPLYEAEALTDDTSAERFMAPSGLTGLWQVKKRGTDDMTTEERITLDRIYARKHSMALDLKLIFKTFSVFIQKESV